MQCIKCVKLWRYTCSIRVASETEEYAMVPRFIGRELGLISANYFDSVRDEKYCVFVYMFCVCVTTPYISIINFQNSKLHEIFCSRCLYSVAVARSSQPSSNDTARFEINMVESADIRHKITIWPIFFHHHHHHHHHILFSNIIYQTIHERHNAH